METKHPVADQELEALRRWIVARPPTPPDREADADEICRCARVLAEGASGEDEILTALVVLAGSPLRLAGEALRRYVAAPHPDFALLAGHAWEEWQFWSPAPLRQVA